MKKTIAFFKTAITYLLYKWLLVIINLFKKLLESKKRAKEEKQEVPRRIRKAAKTKCVPIRHPNYHRPDPMIYSQYYLMKQGMAVTWDNPDIQLYANGNPVPSHGLKPDTEYEIRARCWNLSYDAPVVGMPVRFQYLSFGAGTTVHPIGQDLINLSVIGGSENPSFARVKWRTPATGGHYCIQAVLQWSDDKNPDNNLGQENVDVVQAHSPANFEFTVKNQSKREHNYHIEADTYTIPPLLSCRDTKRLGKAKKEMILTRNGRSNFPIPNDWSIEYSEQGFTLAPNEERLIKVAVTPPGSFKGSKPLNFNVFDEEDVFIGGVTVTIKKD